jgi:hypothetical protein
MEPRDKLLNNLIGERTGKAFRKGLARWKRCWQIAASSIKNARSAPKRGWSRT